MYVLLTTCFHEKQISSLKVDRCKKNLSKGKCTQRVPNIVVQKLLIIHFSNLRPSYNSTIGDWSKIGNLMTKPWLFYVLDQFATHGLQYGQNWKDDKFWGHCILVLETLSAFFLYGLFTNYVDKKKWIGR